MVTTEKPTWVSFTLKTFNDTEIQSLLDAETNFRKVDLANRNKLLDIMREGNWCPGNGECLAFNDSGELVNGQHRLMAAQTYQRETGNKVWFWCAEGVREADATNMDNGKSRRFRDYLERDGVKRASYASAIVLAACKMDHYGAGSNLEPTFRNVMEEKGKFAKKFPIDRMIDTFRRHRKEVEYWAEVGEKLCRSGAPNPGMLASIGYQLAKQHNTEAKLFFSYLVDGTDLKAGDPILMLRERFRDNKVGVERIPSANIAAVTVKAWVAWMRGEQPRILRWRGSGPKAEEFPDHRVKAS